MELPVYEMILSEDDKTKGPKLLSLVSHPAMLIDFAKFSASPKPNVKFIIQSEEQRIIFGPLLIPELPVYRNEFGKEFFLKISAPTIAEYSIRMSQMPDPNLFDVNHSQQPIDGVVMFEKAITNPDRFPVAAGYEDLPIGTLFAASKVYNDQVWAKIKAGEINGYSIDANFSDFKKAESLDKSTVDAEINHILTNS